MSNVSSSGGAGGGDDRFNGWDSSNAGGAAQFLERLQQAQKKRKQSVRMEDVDSAQPTRDVKRRVVDKPNPAVPPADGRVVFNVPFVVLHYLLGYLTEMGDIVDASRVCKLWYACAMGQGANLSSRIWDARNYQFGRGLDCLLRGEAEALEGMHVLERDARGDVVSFRSMPPELLGEFRCMAELLSGYRVHPHCGPTMVSILTSTEETDYENFNRLSEHMFLEPDARLRNADWEISTGLMRQDLGTVESRAAVLLSVYMRMLHELRTAGPDTRFIAGGDADRRTIMLRILTGMNSFILRDVNRDARDFIALNEATGLDWDTVQEAIRWDLNALRQYLDYNMAGVAAFIDHDRDGFARALKVDRRHLETVLDLDLNALAAIKRGEHNALASLVGDSQQYFAEQIGVDENLLNAVLDLDLNELSLHDQDAIWETAEFDDDFANAIVAVLGVGYPRLFEIMGWSRRTIRKVLDLELNTICQVLRMDRACVGLVAQEDIPHLQAYKVFQNESFVNLLNLGVQPCLEFIAPLTQYGNMEQLNRDVVMQATSSVVLMAGWAQWKYVSRVQYGECPEYVRAREVLNSELLHVQLNCKDGEGVCNHPVIQLVEKICVENAGFYEHCLALLPDELQSHIAKRLDVTRAPTVPMSFSQEDEVIWEDIE